MKPKHPYRRGFFINPRFQLRFLLYTSALALFGFGIICVASLSFFMEMSAMGESIGLSETHPYFELVEKQKRLLLVSLLVSGTIALVFILIGGFVLSHKIATPILKVRQHMQLFRSDIEHLPPFKLEDKDFFPELEDVVNDSIGDFMTQIDAMNNLINDYEEGANITRSNDPEDYR